MAEPVVDAESTIHRRTAWLPGAAIGALLVLLIAPMTRWLLLSQLRLAVPVPGAIASVLPFGLSKSSTDAGFADRAFQTTVERYPNDLQLQIAAAMLIQPEHGELDSKVKLSRLRALEPRFADRPELYATILRFETMGEVMVHREEENLLAGAVARSNYHPQPVAPETLAAFDRAAAAGERLDPNNGYFPFMRAVGLFNDHRDSEAMAAVHRAATRPTWSEYCDQELKGEWRLNDLAFGNRSALLHTITASALLFPQYASLRAVTRMEIYHAAKAEQAGDTATGLAIRKDVLTCGRILRCQSKDIIGSLVGIAIEHLAIGSPGGITTPASYDTTTSKRNTEAQLQQFESYLQRIGRAQEIDPFRTELLAGDRVKSLVETNQFFPFDTLFLHPLAFWTADLLLLSNALWLLILGAGAALLLKRGLMATGLPLSEAMRWSLPTGLVAGLFVSPIAYGWGVPEVYSSCLLPLLAAFALPALILPAAHPLGRARRLGVFAGSTALGCLFLGMLVWQCRGIVAFTGLAQIFENLSGVDKSHWYTDWPKLLAVAAYTTPLVSAVVLLASTTVSIACKVPVSVGIARAFRGLAIPVSSVLVLIYALLLLPTLRSEAALQYGMDRNMQDECRYLAELSGKTWPDVQPR